MHPRNMTDDEILTEAERQYPADPLIAALVKMAADNAADYRETHEDVAEQFGFHTPEALREFLESCDDLAE